MSVPLIEKLIQRQINQWNRYRELLGDDQRAKEIEPRPIITISRRLGSGGRLLAETLAARLDLQVHGQDIIDFVAGHKNLERQVVAQLDEQMQSRIDLWIKGVLNHRIFMRDEFHVALCRAVRTLAALGGVVILGRGGNFILSDVCSLRLRLVAAPETRVAAVMASHNLSREDARLRIQESDGSRAHFVEELFHAGIDDASQYDLVINTDQFALDQLVDMVLLALEKRAVTTAGLVASAGSPTATPTDPATGPTPDLTPGGNSRAAKA